MMTGLTTTTDLWLFVNSKVVPMHVFVFWFKGRELLGTSLMLIYIEELNTSFISLFYVSKNLNYTMKRKYWRSKGHENSGLSIDQHMKLVSRTCLIRMSTYLFLMTSLTKLNATKLILKVKLKESSSQNGLFMSSL